MSEKCRRGKNTRMGGSDPTFRSFGSQSDPWVAPAHPLAMTVPTVFAPPLQKEEREKGKMPNEECVSDVVDGYTRFFGPESDRVVDCVPRDRLVGDHDCKRWNGRLNRAAPAGSAIQWAGAR